MGGDPQPRIARRAVGEKSFCRKGGFDRERKNWDGIGWFNYRLVWRGRGDLYDDVVICPCKASTSVPIASPCFAMCDASRVSAVFHRPSFMTSRAPEHDVKIASDVWYILFPVFSRRIL